MLKLEPTQLIEYQGDFYTPEELAAKLQATGDFRVVVESSWFSEAIQSIDEEKQ